MNVYEHEFQSAKADGGDATLVRPSNWNEKHRIGIELTNRTGGGVVSGDIVALSAAADESVVLDDTLAKNRKYIVAAETIADVTAGLFLDSGAWTMKVAGATTRGNYLTKSATAKALEDTGRAAASEPPIAGDVAIALTGSVGAGTVVGAFLGGGGGASFTKGADIASASALPVPSGVFYAHVTGTTGITSIDTLPAGTLVVLEFDGILTITHSAGLLLQGAVDHVTVAGEVLAFVSEGSGNWRQWAPAREVLQSLRTLGAVTVGTIISLGTSPATTGTVNLPNNQAVAARNAADSGDVVLLYLDASDRPVLGPGGSVNIIVNGQLRADIVSTARIVLPVGADKWAV